jgi:site-specific recombinase XerD
VPKTSLSPTTGVSRRHDRHGPVAEGLDYPSRFVGGALAPQPAVASVAPRPFGELGSASAVSLAELATQIWEGHSLTRQHRGIATGNVLEYLATFPGGTWQERWQASPVGQGQVAVNDLERLAYPTIKPSTGLRALICLRAIQPSMAVFRRNTMQNFSPMFIATQDDPQLHAYAEHVQAHIDRHIHRADAVHEMCMLLATQGVSLRDVTAASIVHFAHEYRRAWAELAPGAKAGNRLRGQGVWHVLHATGHLPSTVPPTMRAAMLRGQRSVEELIDRYPIHNQAVRALLIDYLNRRRADTDYATLKHLVADLANNFWVTIERINPAQADLRIAPETYAAWRESIKYRTDGKERAGQDGLVITVRSFYYDLHTWAAQEPERWAVWVAPCPVPPTELHGLGSRRRRINERSADRTRQRQPMLPLLVEHVEQRYERARELLTRAENTPDGESFELHGTTYTREITDSDRKQLRHDGIVPPRLREAGTGELIHVGTEEDAAFWEWAAVETLRHSGVRIEELCELSHLSVRQYQRPNGEVVALLVVAPSKTDRERVIPMSAELFHVIASIIRRHTRSGRTIPLLARYDPHDKVWSPPMPFLFQRHTGPNPRVFSTAAIQAMIGRSCEQIAEQHPAFRGLKFTPHDFRRIFITELVNSGLPIHIGAALLGHLNIQTTRGYVAVFDDDVIRHYQQHLQQRRQIRPEAEYREATPDEWSEFEEHFDLRKVELGSCNRPYGSPCQHEHACIRCPMLDINPKMFDRLGEIEDDLAARRKRAKDENWRGEIEGIDLTLSFLRAKRAETERRLQRPAVHLGIPSTRISTPEQPA